MPASIVGSGRVTVAAAGTRVQFGAAGTTMTPAAGAPGTIRSVWLRAIETNTNVVVIGGSGVVAAAATRNGIALAATGVPIEVPVDDLGDLWVDAITNGEGVGFMYLAS